jgi:hypothetical protein
MGVVERDRGRPRRRGAIVTGALLLAAALAPAGVSYTYDVVAEPGAHVLRVEATFRPAPAGCYAVDRGWGELIEAPELDAADGWQPLERRGECVELATAAAERRVRYRFRLAEAVARNERSDAWRRGEVAFARPSVWLLRPAHEAAGTFRLTVRTPEGLRFATGLPPAGPDAYEGRAENIAQAPYSLFAPLTEWDVDAGGGRIHVALAPGRLTVTREDLDEWVRRAATAVAGYVGAFPLPNVLVAIVPSERGRVGFGTTWGFGGASIVIGVGASATRTDLRGDWELTHEMVHLVLPNMPRGARWMEEGLATYVEPLARAAAGQKDEAEVWGARTGVAPSSGSWSTSACGNGRTAAWACASSCAASTRRTPTFASNGALKICWRRAIASPAVASFVTSTRSWPRNRGAPTSTRSGRGWACSGATGA